MGTTNILQINQITTSDLERIIKDSIQEVLSLNINKPQDTEEVFLTRKETAEMLNVCFATLHNWKRSGILLDKKIGKKVFYLKSDVLAVLNPNADR